MATTPDQLSQFKTAIATATSEVPRLGPQSRTGALTIAEVERKLAAWFSTATISPRLHPLLRSAALLWHDHLDASHTIAQDIESTEGSWLHGIMHRREPDYGNAKYWFRRVGPHVAFKSLAERVATLQPKVDERLTERLIQKGAWQSFSFIEECERAEQGNNPGLTATLRQIQAAEFDALVEHILADES